MHTCIILYFAIIIVLVYGHLHLVAIQIIEILIKGQLPVNRVNRLIGIREILFGLIIGFNLYIKFFVEEKIEDFLHW